jgi:energy-coupling factor transporter ATP-binding protein EcfA2
MLAVEAASSSYGSRSVLDSVSFVAGEGGFLALLEINDSGKSYAARHHFRFSRATNRFDDDHRAQPGRVETTGDGAARESSSAVDSRRPSVYGRATGRHDEMSTIARALMGGPYLVWIIRRRTRAEEI